MFVPSLRADVLVMDDFNDGTINNLLGAGEGALSGASSIAFVSTTTVGNRGFARSVYYNTTGGGGHGMYTTRPAISFASYRYVSFWIKGQAGGESVYCLLEDSVRSPKVRVGSFLPDKITSDFQKVVIPTGAFSGLIDWSAGGAGGNFKIEANSDLTTGIGTVYIDDIRFGLRPSPIIWDNFNDGAAPFNYGMDYESYINPAGASFSPGYDNSLFYGTTGYSYKIVFTSHPNTTEALFLIPSTGTGMDLTGTDKLSFQLAGNSFAAGNNLGISLKDVPGAEAIVQLTSYLGGGIPSGFQTVQIPISDFTTANSALSVTSIRSVNFWFQKSGSPLITPTSSYTLYLDNIRFIDTSSPTAPSSFQSGGSAIAEGTVFNATNTLTATAGAGSGDSTLEEVRFEHDGMTGGATWYTIGVDTDLADTSYGTVWYTSTLPRGTSYHIRAVAVDVQGNYSAAGPFTVEVNTVAPNAPGLAGFQIYSTSATVFLTLNGNSTNTIVAITTGSFETSTSSSGRATTLTFTGLTANTTYTLSARAVSGALTSTTTAVASTGTLAAVPVINSFSGVGISSITVGWSANGNPLTPPTSYYVQIATSSDFGAVTTSTTFLTQATTASLFSNTTYYFRVAAFHIVGGTTSFSAYAATATLPVAPGLNSFQVFTTSVSVTLNPNGNFAGTVLAVTTSSFEISASSSGPCGSGNTTYLISGLTANRDYTLVARAMSFSNTPSSQTTVASTTTLPAVPGAVGFSAVSRSSVTVTWSTNGNSLLPATSYQMQASSDPAFAVYSASTTFLSTATAGGLNSDTTYYFRVFAFGVGGTNSGFNTAVATNTGGSGVVVTTVLSTGGTISAGSVNVTADPGVTIVNTALTDGTTEQTITSTQSASVAYSNGFLLALPGGVAAKVTAGSDSMQLTSTQSVPVTNSGFLVEPTSGLLTLRSNFELLSVIVATDAPQNVQTTLPAMGSKQLEVKLNPPSGEIATTLLPGSFSEAVKMRSKLPESFPAAGAIRWRPAEALFAPAAAPALRAPGGFNPLGVGLEVVLDRDVQPSKPVSIVISWRDSDVAGKDTQLLTVGRYDDAAGSWVRVPAEMDLSSRKARVTAAHLSKFQLMILSPAANVERALAYPNPLLVHRGQTQMTITNLSAYAKLKIYTTTGELVRELEADATGTALWDARNLYGNKAASGLYLLRIEGAADSEKILKIMVER